MKFLIPLVSLIFIGHAYAFDMGSVVDKVKDKANSKADSESSSGIEDGTDSAVEMAKKKAKKLGQKVDLNHASEKQLRELPGVGPVKAHAIVVNRPYDSIEDLKKKPTPGFTDELFEKIKDKITVK